MVKIRSQGCTLYSNVRATELGKGRWARRVVRAMLTMSKQHKVVPFLSRP